MSADDPAADHESWMLALSPADRAACARDLAAAATDRESFDMELTAWRETATAIAAGLNQPDLEWLDRDDGEVVERP